MMSLTHIQSTIRMLYRERHAPEHLKFLADVWWWSMLTLGTVLFVGAAGYSAYELMRSRDVLSATEHSSNIAPPVLDKDALTKTLSQYESRAALYSSVQSNLPTTTDPSI